MTALPLLKALAVFSTACATVAAFGPTPTGNRRPNVVQRAIEPTGSGQIGEFKYNFEFSVC